VDAVDQLPELVDSREPVAGVLRPGRRHHDRPAAAQRPGVLITTVDTGRALYDSTVAWRERAMSGTLHSGAAVHDRRSADRTSL